MGHVFSSDRFLEIWKFLHFVDEEDEGIDKSDKLYKVGPLTDSVVSKFRIHYIPTQDVT